MLLFAPLFLAEKQLKWTCCLTCLTGGDEEAGSWSAAGWQRLRVGRGAPEGRVGGCSCEEKRMPHQDPEARARKGPTEIGPKTRKQDGLNWQEPHGKPRGQGRGVRK